MLFKASLINGLPPSYYAQPEPKIINPDRRDEALERFFTETKADIYTGTEAAYSVKTDRIEMPPFETFASARDFYGTQAHELTHWTGHPSPLNRDLRGRFGDAAYAKEELIAELGACFLGADLGFAPWLLEGNAAYIQHW